MWDHMKNKKEKKKQAQVITFKYNQTLRHNHSKTQKNYNQKEEIKSRMHDTTVTMIPQSISRKETSESKAIVNSIDFRT